MPVHPGALRKWSESGRPSRQSPRLCDGQWGLRVVARLDHRLRELFALMPLKCSACETVVGHRYMGSTTTETREQIRDRSRPAAGIAFVSAVFLTCSLERGLL